MESSLRSRKRKQRPSKSDQLDGIFTRSRSQIYIHKNRSGHARPDCNRTLNLINSHKFTTKTLVKLEQIEAAVDQITSQSSVKDLRARRVFSPATTTHNDEDDDDVSITDVDLKGDKFDGNLNVMSSVANVGVSDSLRITGDDVSFGDVDLKGESEIVVDSENLDLVRENDVMEADDVVQMTPIVTNELVSVVNEIVDAKASMSKSQSSVTSLRGRKKVFKSPSSFSYRRMLPFLTDVNDDSSNFELVEMKLPEQVQKSSNKPSNTIVTVSNCSKLADTFNKAKSPNPDIVMTVESSIVVQNSNDDVINDTLDDCVQMTPPDSDIFSQSNIDKTSGVTVKPTSKLISKSCSQMKVLQTPTSFSHRRLLPFLMSVSGDNSCTLKSIKSLKLEKVTEQNQCQNVSMDESKTESNSEKPTTTDEKSDSPTSTLIPVDTSFNIIKTVTLVSSDSLVDAGGLDIDCSGSTSQLKVNLQAEKAVKSGSSIKLEQSSPKNNLKSVEEAVSKALVTCTEQNIETSDGKERPHQSLLQITPVNTLGINGRNILSGILKRTPRGCRGICNCLNCTSFRLHAERSFEFSRNQMYDAEEVALELINELSSIRNILEKTASDCNSLDTDKEKQVKEACEKALYKEEVARARLAQMNEDLSIHCRSMKLLRPKVTFANKIEEKVISKDHVFGTKSV